MTLILDAAPLVALADETDPRVDAIFGTLRAEPGDLVLPAFVAAEVDYLIGDRLGSGPQRAFLEDLAAGTYRVEKLTIEEHRRAVELDQRHPGLGLADLSIVLLADRFRTNRLLTFDERDFRAVRPLRGDAFVLLPADA